MNFSLNKKLFWSYSTEIVIGILQPLLLIVLSNRVDVQVFGVVSMLIIILTLSKVVLDASSKYLITVSNDRLNSTTISAICVNLMFAIIIFLGLIFFRGIILDYFEIVIPTNLFIVFYSQLFLFAIGMPIQMYFTRDLKLKELFFYRIIFSLGPQLISISLLFLVFSPIKALILGYTIGAIISTGTLFLKFIPVLKISHLENLFVDKSYRNFTLLNFLDIAGIAMFSAFDILLVGKYLGTESAGIYKLSNSLSVLLTSFLISPIIGVLFPLFTRNKRENTSSIRLFLDIWKLIFLINLLVFTILFLLNDLPYLIVGFNLSKWKFLNQYVILIGAFNLLGWLAQPFSEFYKSTNKSRLNVVFMYSQFLLLIPLYRFGVEFGMYGLMISKILFALLTIIVHFMILGSMVLLPMKNIIIFLVKYILLSLILCLLFVVFEDYVNRLFYVSLTLLVSVYFVLKWDKYYIKRLYILAFKSK